MSILVAIDGETVPSEPLAVGYDLSNAYGTELIVVHVMPKDVFDEFQASATGQDRTITLAGNLSYGSDGRSGTRGSEYSVQNGERNAAKVARDVVEGTLEGYSGVTFQGRVGDPVTELLAEADR